jgi:hypothetical protein
MGITLNGEDKLITLDTNTSFTSNEIYKACVDWAVLSGNMQYLIPMVASGKEPLGSEVFTDIIYILSNGWKLTTSGYDEGEQITVLGTLITDDTSNRTVLGDTSVNWVFQVATYGTITNLKELEIKIDDAAILRGII